MATFKFEGTDEYIHKITILHEKSANTLKGAVYEGAAVIADVVKAALHEHDRTGDLASSMALVAMRNDNGFINTKINFADYDRNGVPNAVKAAALESGTSRGQPKLRVISKAANGAKERAEAVMAAKVDEMISKIMEE